MGAWLYIQRGDLVTGRAYLNRGVEVSEQVNDPTALAFTLHKRGISEVAEGEWDRAHADFERAVSMIRQTGTSWASAGVLYGMGHLYLVTGETGAATRYFDELFDLARGSSDMRVISPFIHAQCVLAERDLLAGKSEAALTRLMAVRDRGEIFEGTLNRMPSILAWAYLDTGAVDKAQEIIMKAITGAADWSTTVFGKAERADALRVGALVALRQERWSDARAALQQSLDVAKQTACLYAEAKALAVYGQLHVAEGKPERAREQYEAALAICGRLGERLYAGEIERALSELEEGDEAV
jgi:tetratricopeptide (TPR) repeat protein